MHLTFLVDVSGSMDSPDRLPLAKESLKLLLGGLLEQDTVSLVTYAGGVSEVLPPTPATSREVIARAIDGLRPLGGTDMGSGMELAFRNAVRMLRPGEVSRVIVLTDGDANIGHTSHQQILKSIASYVKEGVTLTTVGYGTGNYRDEMLEQLADQGNGNSYYVDGLPQARRLFQEQLGGMLEVVAKDVKLQVEFDPQAVKRYRLIGYENRDIADKDFRNDRVDSGDVGAGHAVTALFALELAPEAGQHLATVRVRAKPPSGEVAREQAFPIARDQRHPGFDQAPRSFRLAAAAAGLADALRGNAHATWPALERVAAGCEGPDPDARELRDLIRLAARLSAPASN
jgi:Ca-activated chloride channel family protein